MIAFAHIANTVNVGDKVCSPYDYFLFHEARKFDLGDSIPPCKAVIFGGGAIEPRLRADGLHRIVKAKVKIAWGIGTSRSRTKDPGPLVEDLDLCGVREFDRPGGIYVPCASCMSPLFDFSYPVRHPYVFYLHAAKSIPDGALDGVPVINNRTPFADAIEFLGSGETVITNSYHGTYWGILLNRKVVCLPFSSKFHHFKFRPTMATAKDWRDVAPHAISHRDALEDARFHNKEFHRRVLNIIE